MSAEEYLPEYVVRMFTSARIVRCCHFFLTNLLHAHRCVIIIFGCKSSGQIAWYSLIIARLSVVCVLMFPLQGAAEEVNAASSVGAASAVGAASPPVETANKMDSSRNYLSGKLESWAKGLDSFFGDYRNYQESNDSVIQLDLTQVTGYLGEPKYDFAMNLKISLPNTEKRTKFLIETNPEERTKSGPTNIQAVPSDKVSTPRSIAAALRYEKTEAERWHFSTDGGIQLAGLASTPFVRARLSLAMPLDDWRMSVAETTFWFRTIGAGESTLIDFERTLGKNLLFRASSNATWLNETQSFDLSQSFSFFHTWSERSALLYQFNVVGVSKTQAQVTDYVILMTCRYRLHREWVYLEISPQVHFPQSESYQTSKLLSVRLEFLLDTSR